MAYYIKSTTIVRSDVHADIMREIAFSDHTEQTIIKTKLVGVNEVKCYEEVFDGDSEEDIYTQYMAEGDWEHITKEEFEGKECSSFEEINDENRGIITRSRKM